MKAGGRLESYPYEFNVPGISVPIVAMRVRDHPVTFALRAGVHLRLRVNKRLEVMCKREFIASRQRVREYYRTRLNHLGLKTKR